MGKVLKILGVVFLVGVLGFAALLYFAHQKGASVQAEFYKAVLSGDVTKVEAKFAPSLRKEVDEPVLAAWMAAVKERLGAYKGLSGKKFSTAMSHKDGVDRVDSTGTVNFEHGEAQSDLVLIGGKIAGFHVRAKAWPENWMTRLDDRSVYERRAETFLQKLLAGDAAAALEMMHPNLRRKFEGRDFASGLVALHRRFGDKPELKLVSSEFNPGTPPEVRVHHTLQSGSERVKTLVRYELEGMRFRLIGFAVPAKD
jgi:hypothetical protein